ncbi:MAG: hypothetical protein IT169_13310 [Bryobacterales bacterium]|nr:hypothetical protein [Bryobacterales bacterium]
MNSLLVMADDATGALEAGAILASLGKETVVELEMRRRASAEAHVLLVPTRHDSPAMARRRVEEVVAWAAASPAEALPRCYWKTDSTLRGPIGACFDALLQAFPLTPLVYVPAYPAMGRTVVNGILRVNGVPLAETAFAADALNPVRSSAVAEALSPELRFPIERICSPRQLRAHLETARSEALLCDAGTEADVAALFAECRAARPFPLAAGPAGGIRYWAGDCAANPPRRGPATPPRREPANPPRREPTNPPRRAPIEDVPQWLVVCGSRHPIARAQGKHARRLGFTVLATPAEESRDAEAELAALAGRAAALARGGMVIFGGDTALAVWRAMGVARLVPLGEFMPGVAVSRAAGCTFVTAAGGFPAPGLLEELLAAEER